MPDSLEQAMTFGAGTAIPDSTGMLDGEGGGSGEPHDPSSSGSDGEIAACACSCDELVATDVASEDFKAHIAAGEEPSMTELSGFMRCANTCQREYMICRMEQADAEKKAEQEKRDQQKGTPDSCDCSCQQMTANNERAKELEKLFAAGGNVPLEDIMSLTRCAEVCQQQHMACIMEKKEIRGHPLAVSGQPAQSNPDASHHFILMAVT
jgi:hypothetical protein